MNTPSPWGWRLSVLLALLCFVAMAVSFHNSIGSLVKMPFFCRKPRDENWFSIVKFPLTLICCVDMAVQKWQGCAHTYGQWGRGLC